MSAKILFVSDDIFFWAASTARQDLGAKHPRRRRGRHGGAFRGRAFRA
jgi:hypothetical protein